MIRKRDTDDDGGVVSFSSRLGTLTASGRTTVVLIVVACAVMVLLGAVWLHEEATLRRADETTRRYQALMTAIKEAADRMNERQAEANYILILSPEDRKALKLDMPESMRRKLGR